MAHTGKNIQELLTDFAITNGHITTGGGRYTKQQLLNLIAGQTDLSYQAAMNAIAGTTGLRAQDAANVRAGTTGLRIQDAIDSWFTPATLSSSGLVMWVQAGSGAYTDAGTTLATNGQTVRQWNDLSGNGEHFVQATETNRPTFVTEAQNGRPAIRFDGVDNFLVNTTLPSTVATTGRTVFVALKATAASGATKRFFATSALGSVFDNSGVYAYYATSGPAVAAIGGAVTTPTVITLSFVGGGNATPYSSGTAAAAFTPSTVIDGFVLGAQSAAGGEYKECDIYEVIIYNTPLSAGNRALVHSYLGSKYSISIAA
jgi:hypothetical protein